MKVDAATKGIGITSTDRMSTLGWKGGSTAELATRKIVMMMMMMTTMVIDDNDDDDDDYGDDDGDDDDTDDDERNRLQAALRVPRSWDAPSQ